MALFLSACAEPPHKEMDQAQGAIDAARAAGADRYAPTEYAAAVDALKRSNEAATQGDYRLALNHALDSGERAREAARLGADSKAQLRGEAERALAELSIATTQLEQRLAAARKLRPARPGLRTIPASIKSIEGKLQKARELLAGGDYLAAQPLLQEIRKDAGAASGVLDVAMSPQSPRRRR